MTSPSLRYDTGCRHDTAGREGQAKEVADLVVYLASESASFVNGTNVDINGGIFSVRETLIRF